jgi:hypothetical protein
MPAASGGDTGKVVQPNKAKGTRIQTDRRKKFLMFESNALSSTQRTHRSEDVQKVDA